MSYSAARFSSMHTQALGAAAYMGILESVMAEREQAQARATLHSNLMSEVDQLIFQTFYAQRYASICPSTRSLARTDCLDLTTTTIYRNPRAARRAALVNRG